ncbi:MAG: WGR domain-containing protein [Archangium sp.]|nr:WGR domain-containing protein [Archangium sp.]MDP3570850.1 WGR domain-containing protein [Archangium sp.]
MASKKTAAPAAAAKKKLNIPVDDACSLKGAAVHEDYDCILNQTNIGANNNKFYVIQLLTKGGKFYAWTRWGRVGETGQSALVGPSSFEGAFKAFAGKFKDKTSNKWEERAAFKPASGRYTLIEVDRSADTKKAEELEAKLKGIDSQAAKLQGATEKKFKPTSLHPRVQKFMHLIFDHDMFKGAMASFDIDVKKMPLGQLSSSQVKRGYEVLEALGRAIKAKKKPVIMVETSRFYTVIPHAFGRNTPPLIDTTELLDKKMEMLNVLSDIEIAIAMQSAAAPVATKKEKLAPHPDDENYKKLNAELEQVAPGSEEHDFIQKYIDATASSHRKPKVIDIFRLDRKGEAERYKAHEKLGNRKLLWHGTNVAVVAAICKSGLRIMPHSGGRVGKGIYTASENGKSINYMGWARGNIGVMFLAEVALGKEHSITKDDHSLKAAPKGFHSVVARGRREPDPKHDLVRKYDGKPVVIPQGKPQHLKQYASSRFEHSEYLVYQESQVRIRYAIHVQG